ncbi:MAG: type I glyceraldehyde-3-phosphate dehydrogenase [Pseudomonadales bacterium]|nr:type I glyceraldehyde-3-phosphate dehydrogenase [Pseudomonadales bacterium]NRA18092.1 type I glyceraldehyde-3-phosphate dehydrogenase [Oceanospirillaceae bacterium]
MTIRVAINGFGRIGRNILRALYEGEHRKDIQIVAINDLGAADINAHLFQYDSVHGPFQGKVSHDQENLFVNDDKIAILAERDPSKLPWKQLKIDVVYECTGFFTHRDQASAHITAGSRKVIISAPGKEVDATVVYGVNHQQLRAEHQIISNASCTTNCLAPIAQVLDQHIGIESGIMTTIHAYTNDQNLSDTYHSDPYRARSATSSMIPTSTGAAAAVGLVLPELAGKIDGMAMRVPIINVSVVDFSFIAKTATSVTEINALLMDASKNSKVLGFNTQPLVSIDFNHNPLSSIFDATQTKVSGRQVKVMSWYDNEWGFSNRMLDNTLALINAPATES